MLVLQAGCGTPHLGARQAQGGLRGLDRNRRPVHVRGRRESQQLHLGIGIRFSYQPPHLAAQHIAQTFPAGEEVGVLQRQPVRLCVRLGPVRLLRQAGFAQLGKDPGGDVLIKPYIYARRLSQGHDLERVLHTSRAEDEHALQRCQAPHQRIPCLDVTQPNPVNKEPDGRTGSRTATISQPVQVLDIRRMEPVHTEPGDVPQLPSTQPHHGRLTDPRRPA